MLQQKATHLHVPEADRSDLDARLLYHFDVRINVESPDVFESFGTEGLICLVETQPNQVKRLNCEGVGQAEPVVNRYKLVFVSVILSDQDIAAVTVQVQNPQIQDCDLVHLISTKKVRGVVLDGPAAFDKALQ